MGQHSGAWEVPRAPGPAPTTRAQVSGHRFLSRRVRHGLVFGDIRMIHDPLARRRRAVLFGLVAAALCAGCAGLMALIDPAPDPGDATVVRANSGALYVRVAGEAHPVANLASARLIAGSPEDPAEVSMEHLSQFRLGLPVGIADAPGVLATEPPAPGRHWHACVGDDAEVTVAYTARARPLPDGQGVLARIESGREMGDWLITPRGRWGLPEEDSAVGRAVRRRLGVDAATPVWYAPSDVVAAAPALGKVALPEPLPEVVVADGDYWARFEGTAVRLSQFQAAVLLDVGAQRVAGSPATRREVADLPEARPLVLPQQAPELVGPEDQVLCTGLAGRAIATLDASDVNRDPAPGESLEGVDVRVPLPHGGLARWFLGPQRGAFAVDTGAGVQVVTDSGTRHRLDAPETREVLGLPVPIEGWWPVLRLLPEGAGLSVEEAQKTWQAGGPVEGLVVSAG